MRIARYLSKQGSAPAVGIIDDEDNIYEVHGSGGDLGALLLLDKESLEKVAKTSIIQYKVSEVRLLAPIGNPGKILALAGNYHPHNSLKDVDVEIESPQFFIKPRTSLIGPGEVIPNTNGSSTLNTIEEIELGVIIGKPGKNISLSNAYEHVFGYTIMNDFSGRDLKLHPDRNANHWIEWLNGKWLDGFCPAGPWTVIAEDIKDPNNLQLTTKINGEIRVKGNTNRMLFDIPHQIEYISRLTTLEPGDMICTGVVPLPDGVDDEIYIKPGDLIEGIVEGIGTLSNRVGL
tara:strand:- start:63 stop:929 length:867 start_codon:yes stop_codon:yes gene_type:complete